MNHKQRHARTVTGGWLRTPGRRIWKITCPGCGMPEDALHDGARCHAARQAQIDEEYRARKEGRHEPV